MCTTSHPSHLGKNAPLDFETWFKNWDTTKDPEIERLCRIAWSAAQSVTYASTAPLAAVDHPPHYNVGKIEVIDAIEDWKLGFHLGNVVKYVVRAGRKGDWMEDLHKARWYLDRYIEQCVKKLEDEMKKEKT